MKIDNVINVEICVNERAVSYGQKKNLRINYNLNARQHLYNTRVKQSEETKAGNRRTSTKPVNDVRCSGRVISWQTEEIDCGAHANLKHLFISLFIMLVYLF